MKNRSRLFGWKEPFDVARTEGLFLEAVKENCRFQYEHCEPYRKILEHFQFSPEDLKENNDIERLPFLPTWVFNGMEDWQMAEAVFFLSGSLYCAGI